MARLAFCADQFIMIGALVNAGALGALSKRLAHSVVGRPLLTSMVLLWGSALLPGILDNIPTPAVARRPGRGGGHATDRFLLVPGSHTDPVTARVSAGPLGATTDPFRLYGRGGQPSTRTVPSGQDLSRRQLVGMLLGVLVAQQHPELFRGFIGAGQMVSPRDTDRIFYADTLVWARSTGNSALVEQLTASGPPPYADMLGYESALTYEHQVYPLRRHPRRRTRRRVHLDPLRRRIHADGATAQSGRIL